MSDATALFAACNQFPDEDTPRLMLADELDAHGGSMVCPMCDGVGVIDNPGGGHDDLKQCPTCYGTGRIHARDLRLAVALRAVLTHPDRDEPRLAWAEIAERNAGEVACGVCEGRGYRNIGTVREPCLNCRNADGEPTGRVSDGWRERGELVRVQCELAKGCWACEGKGTLLGSAGDRSNPVCGECRTLELRRRERELLMAHGLSWLSKPLMDLEAKQAKVFGACQYRRGFIDSLTLSAADWLSCEATVFWHPDQRVTCPECEDESPYRIYCKRCEGSGKAGTIARPFIATAHPITRVKLTGVDDDSPAGWGYFHYAGSPESRDSRIYDRWPTIVFEMPNG